MSVLSLGFVRYLEFLGNLCLFHAFCINEYPSVLVGFEYVSFILLVNFGLFSHLIIHVIVI